MRHTSQSHPAPLCHRGVALSPHCSLSPALCPLTPPLSICFQLANPNPNLTLTITLTLTPWQLTDKVTFASAMPYFTSLGRNITRSEAPPAAIQARSLV